MHDWTVREVIQDDLDGIRGLFNIVWGYNRPWSFDHWRYFNGPYGSCPAVVALNGSTLVGFYTGLPTKIRVGREIITGIQSMDTLTHPSYQRQGVFVTLAEACYKAAQGRGFEIIYGFPNPNSYPGFVNRLNFDHSGNIGDWVRPIRPSGYLGLPPVLGKAADVAALVWPKGTSMGFEVRIEKPDAAEIDVLLASWCEDLDACCIERTPEWLHWRYSPEAGHDYEWVMVLRAGKVFAAGVWGMRNSTWHKNVDGRAHLMELFGTDPAGLEALLAAIIDRAWLRHAWLIETITNVHSVTAALRRAGFVRHRMAPFIIRALSTRVLAGNIHDHASWRIMGGDIDTL